MARILIGTSGWHYDSWRGPFYPQGLPIRAQLQYYASQFNAAELNGVFYRTPTPHSVKSWKDHTDKDFVFTWKASRFITHWKRLSAKSVNSLELMESRLSLLGDKAAPVLFQCHPTSRLMRTAYPPFFECFHPKDVTASNSATLVGIPHRSCVSSRSTTFRFASPTTMTPRRLGRGRPTSFMSVVMVPEDDTRDTTLRKPWGFGPSASSPGKSKGAMCTWSLITIRRAPRLSMP